MRTAQHISKTAFSCLSAEEWLRHKHLHEEQLDRVLNPYLKKRSQQEKDPVLDFLFEYYPFRPSHLRRWSPGIGVLLELDGKADLPELSELTVEDGHAVLNPAFFPEKRLSSVSWILNLLKQSMHKKPFFGCFGMHEWAMVYRAEKVRHSAIPLRLSDDEIAQFVESRPLLCTHFDAFRFFTEKARPLNRNVLSRDTFAEMEQPGCVHTNMDLYKWAFKLYPWISGDTLRKAFLNALVARKIDMQASPYDATAFGLEPIKIETEAGRKEYLERQTEIYENSMPIRMQLTREYEKVLEWVG
ncbi:3-methyladenine DNA glycosylase [Rhodohalobacter mucosus]|uniref:3-methyladenine DNA glycosylase n=1 Tax=Rhodohalobacter mucosus TaxID=2079485 RepID=A0A316TXA0_9BACT|nr:3-methyladenine DNA glycosylase [Rhodohalobacter mucosus]PWN08079.1 3-methyladenine DNA glycosylase [Rhodohalobacter mucosus]